MFNEIYILLTDDNMVDKIRKKRQMKRLLPFVALMFLVPALNAQSERDEYEIGETGAPKDYDAKTDIPKDYDPEGDVTKRYDEANDIPKDYEEIDKPPKDYNEAITKTVDFNEKTDKAQDYDEGYVEGIVYEPGGREAYRKRARIGREYQVGQTFDRLDQRYSRAELTQQRMQVLPLLHGDFVISLTSAIHPGIDFVLDPVEIRRAHQNVRRSHDAFRSFSVSNS